MPLISHPRASTNRSISFFFFLQVLPFHFIHWLLFSFFNSIAVKSMAYDSSIPFLDLHFYSFLMKSGWGVESLSDLSGLDFWVLLAFLICECDWIFVFFCYFFFRVLCNFCCGFLVEMLVVFTVWIILQTQIVNWSKSDSQNAKWVVRLLHVVDKG